MKNALFLITALLLSLSLFQSCVKTESDDATLATAEDLSTNAGLSDQIDLAANIAIEERGGGGACPVVTLEKPWGTWPNTLTIDYGPDGCAGPNGKNILKGKLIITQTADAFTQGATRTLTFENFFVDAIQVEGTQSWTNNGLNSAAQWSFTKVAKDMKLSYPDGTSNAWNLTHTSTIIQGGLTLTWWDDVWSTTGEISGVNRDGVHYSATTTAALVKKATCGWVSEGAIDLNVGGNTAVIDYGDGDCDNKATVTLPNGDTVTIKLN
ncbi:MAG: hypothetical protein L6Q97_12875 [Thermoanaerobaculia bacterium]|nr:hypothetical protein [Thermoanaerobaculia bacterium]